MPRPGEEVGGGGTRDPKADDCDPVPAGRAHREELSSRTYSRIQAGLSCQVRVVTRLPLTTTSRSTYVPPYDSTSSLHLATVVAWRPLRTPAAARTSMPWQTD